MSTFFLICVVLVLAAVALVAYPLLRPMAAEARQAEAPARAVPVFVLLAIAIPLASAALYKGLTTYPWDDPGSVAASAPAGHGDGSAGSLAQAAQQLEERLKANPADAEGWRMLGRTYLVSGAPDKALAAYEKADQLTGGADAALQLDMAEAIVLGEDPAQLPRAQAILAAALKSNPDEGKALWYTGVLAMRSGDTATARTSFQKLLDQNPPPEIRQIVVEQLASLGVQVPAGAAGPAAGAGMAGAGASAEADTPPTEGRTVRVDVSVAPALAGRVQPGTALFVAARQPGIPGPPLAAVRLTTDQLPTTVVLSDANSMIEGRNLSSVDDVEIVARVAFGGTAVPASGDLLGTAVVSKGGTGAVRIVIDKVSP